MSINKSAILCSLLSLSLLTNTPARATGMIMIDPGLMPHVVPHIAIPSLPNWTPTHTPGQPPRTLLRGTVSFGLRMQSQDIKVSITDQVARTYMKQVFANDTDRNLAGIYLFPLPADTTFSSFSLHIDGKPVEGKILEAAAARQEYEEIVRRMVDPGLLEYADYKTVRARIFPIPPHGTKTVELEYTQILKAENGMLKYSYPLKAEGQTDPVEEIKLTANLISKQGLRSIWSPSNQIKLDRTDNSHAKITMLEKDSAPDKDFMLCYSVSDKDLAANLLTHKNPDEDGYFLLALAPPLHAKTSISKDILFVVDTSGSMQGDKIEETKRAIKNVLKALGSNDRFSIIQFNTDVDYFKSHLLPASEENKQLANAFVDDLNASGGTNISYALQTGCGMLNEASERPAYLILMTDGEPTVGETNESKILKGVSPKREVRIFDFGVGYDVNTRFLNKLAEQHHGTSQYVEPNENLEIAVTNFYEKIKSPFLTDVKLEYDGIQTKDVYPREVKDIFAGSQLMLLGKYKNAGKCTVRLTGKINGVEKSYAFPLNFQSEETGNTYLPRLWAMRRIGYLTDIAHDNGNSREVIDEIVALSKKYGIITEYTSFLVTDPSENIRLGHGLAFHQNLPHQGFINGTNSSRRNGMVGAGAVMGGGYGISTSPAVVNDSFAQSLPASAHFDTAAREYQLIDAHSVKRDFRSPDLSGQLAVTMAKSAKALKESDYVASKRETAAGLKTIADKTFYLTNGVWMDSSIDLAHPPIAKEIVFASKDYFDLIHSQPAIAKYLSVGNQVFLQFKGQFYKIVLPKTS